MSKYTSTNPYTAMLHLHRFFRLFVSGMQVGSIAMLSGMADISHTQSPVGRSISLSIQMQYGSVSTAVSV